MTTLASLVHLLPAAPPVHPSLTAHSTPPCLLLTLANAQQLATSTNHLSPFVSHAVPPATLAHWRALTVQTATQR